MPLTNKDVVVDVMEDPNHIINTEDTISSISQDSNKMSENIPEIKPSSSNINDYLMQKSKSIEGVVDSNVSSNSQLQVPASDRAGKDFNQRDIVNVPPEMKPLLELPQNPSPVRQSKPSVSFELLTNREAVILRRLSRRRLDIDISDMDIFGAAALRRMDENIIVTSQYSGGPYISNRPWRIVDEFSYAHPQNERYPPQNRDTRYSDYFTAAYAETYIGILLGCTAIIFLVIATSIYSNIKQIF